MWIILTYGTWSTWECGLHSRFPLCCVVQHWYNQTTKTCAHVVEVIRRNPACARRVPRRSAVYREFSRQAPFIMPRTTIFLVRHGARHDYNNPERWKEQCTRLGIERLDPPLSMLGHQQAREVAAVLKDEPITHLLASPYLRVLQTAQPLAQALGKPLCVEHGLAEFKHHPARIAPHLGVRVAVLPEVDDEYVSIFPSASFVLDPSGQEPVVEYLRRMLRLAKALPQRHANTTVACFSHAASVALVAALTKQDSLLSDAELTFAPCGIYKLVSDDGGDTWAVEASGASNAAHVTVNDPTTYSWGFMHSSSAQRNEADWKRALALGPNDVEGGACAQGAAGIAEATAQFTISDEQMAALTNRAAGNAFILGLAVGVAASIAVAIKLRRWRR